MSGVSKEELGFDEETAAAADDGTAVADGSRSSKSKVKQKRPRCFANTLSTLNALISPDS